jgi:hypothetical protein
MSEYEYAYLTSVSTCQRNNQPFLDLGYHIDLVTTGSKIFMDLGE